jgi:hypothetical protein
VASAGKDRALARRRHDARLVFLKRRITVASLLGFAALFGLAAQHSVKGSLDGKPRQSLPAQARQSAAPTTFFDEQADGFSFADPGTGFSSSGVPQGGASPAPPVAQTSVS